MFGCLLLSNKIENIDYSSNLIKSIILDWVRLMLNCIGNTHRIPAETSLNWHDEDTTTTQFFIASFLVSALVEATTSDLS